jgi:hypothetical protein
MTPQFRSGQTVRLCRASYRTSSAGDFKIVRVLPDEGGERQYRIKNDGEVHERVVNESDLERV